VVDQLWIRPRINLINTSTHIHTITTQTSHLIYEATKAKQQQPKKTQIDRHHLRVKVEDVREGEGVVVAAALLVPRWNIRKMELNLKLTPWALYPFLVGVLSAAASIRKLPHTILTSVPQRFVPGGRRCSVRPHTVRRPKLALGYGAATRVGFFQPMEYAMLWVNACPCNVKLGVIPSNLDVIHRE